MILKLAALGAEILDILEREKTNGFDWGADTFDLIRTKASLLGLVDGDDEGTFKVASECREAALHLYEDFEQSIDNNQPLCLTMQAGEKGAVFYPGAVMGEESGVSVLIKNRIYEL